MVAKKLTPKPLPKKTAAPKKVGTNTDAIDLKAVAKAQNARSGKKSGK